MFYFFKLIFSYKFREKMFRIVCLLQFKITHDFEKNGYARKLCSWKFLGFFRVCLHESTWSKSEQCSGTPKNSKIWWLGTLKWSEIWWLKKIKMKWKGLATFKGCVKVPKSCEQMLLHNFQTWWKLDHIIRYPWSSLEQCLLLCPYVH